MGSNFWPLHYSEMVQHVWLRSTYKCFKSSKPALARKSAFAQGFLRGLGFRVGVSVLLGWPWVLPCRYPRIHRPAQTDCGCTCVVPEACNLEFPKAKGAGLVVI